MTPSIIATSTYWPLPVRSRLAQRGEQADREVQAGARVADLRAGDERRAVRHAGRAHRAAHRLRARSRTP